MISNYHHKSKSNKLVSSDWLDVVEMHGYKAAIFDCDGTLVNSSESHFLCMLAATMEQGHELEREWYESRSGMDRVSIFSDFRDTHDKHFSVERACDVSIKQFSQFSTFIKPVPLVINFAKKLSQRNIPIAVATNSEDSIAKHSLEIAGILDIFNAVVTVSDGVPPKPAPDIYRLASKILGVSSSQTLVIEDSPEGVSAAISAGSSVIQIV